MPNGKSICRWVSERDAFSAFATFSGGTESAGHIKPLHWYVASRLVVEGGFDPDWITPGPPFRISSKGSKKDRRYFLEFDPSLGGSGEQTILGGLKTKNVDVVVSVPDIGPVLAVSCKGVTKSFRNLTNRMEETIGECTNLHITYPAMVVGYFAVLRANRTLEDAADAPEIDEAHDAAAETPEALADKAGSQDDSVAPSLPTLQKAKPTKATKNDLAFDQGGSVVESIVRFHAALSEMTGRRGIRDEISRYEAMTTVMVEPKGAHAGTAFGSFPPLTSNLHLSKFFQTLYQRYEERFVYGAPLLASTTGRYFWDEKSSAFQSNPASADAPTLDYPARLLE